MRMRPDLVASKHRYHGRIYWIVKEPVGLHYFRFQEEEFAILKMLDGQTSLDEMQEQFEARVSAAENHGRGVGQFHRHAAPQRPGVSDAPGQGAQLKERRDERQRRGTAGDARQHPGDPVQGHRSRPVAQLAVSLDPLDVLVRWR